MVIRRIRSRIRVKEVKMDVKRAVLHVIIARRMVIQPIIVGLGQIYNAGRARNLAMWRRYARTRIISRSCKLR